MFNGAVWKFNSETQKWTEITPVKPEPENGKTFGYAAVAIDAKHPGILLVSTYHRYGIDGGEEIFRSLDYGKTWRGIFSNGAKFDYTIAPYIKNTGVHWMFDIEIDPFNSDHALFTTGYGGHETYNLTAIDTGDTVVWQVMSKGIEETVALDLLSPPGGAQLISAIGDYGGFVHWDPDKSEPEGNFSNPHFGNTDGIACAGLNPDIIVRVGEATHQNERKKNIGYSLNGGKSWRSADTMPETESRHGYVAVSADGSTWIWTPQDEIPYMTCDRGKSWTPCATLPVNTRITADRVNPEKFYGLALFADKIYKSNDRGKSFSHVVRFLETSRTKAEIARR